jgi:hypothetical protein
MYLKMCKKKLGGLNCNTVCVYCTYIFVYSWIYILCMILLSVGGGERTVHFKNLQKSFFPFREVRHNLSGSFQQFWQFLPSFSVSAEQKTMGTHTIYNILQYFSQGTEPFILEHKIWVLLLYISIYLSISFWF